jgi:hypothetical protein
VSGCCGGSKVKVLALQDIQVCSNVEPWQLSVWRHLLAQDAAGQMRKSPHQFSGIGSQSPLLWLVRGYAVLDGPTMPIVAETDDAEPNDTYVTQLVASAKAAVEVHFSP